MRASEIRKRFLSYFADRGHEAVPSASLIPHNDPTLFFVNAGMVQFKDVFTGKETREIPRATSVQKCLRVSGKHNDLENVGRTPRHHTFFEMLGNFSFGDYFKEDAISMAWELLTGELGLDPARLWVTVYEDDDEAYDIWRSKVGFPAERLQRLGAKENFWTMGETGPCGPCSEIHYDHGPGVSSDTRGPAGEDDRYVEIWNLVFMQYEQLADGRQVGLPRPSIDTGAGLERLAAATQGVYSNYDTELFQALIGQVGREADVRYNASPESDVALRVIADHARAAAFLVADGIMPSNEGRGYVLRRIMRRAVRFGVKLGLDRPFLYQTTGEVVRHFGEAYPELQERSAFIEEVVRGEEERFARTLDRGMRLLDAELDRAGDGGVLPGDVAFTLSDTYGFPLDLTRLIAEERRVRVDEDAYEHALEAQRTRGRAAWKGSGEQAVAELWHRLADEHGETFFSGYERDEDVATVLAIVRQTSEDGEVSSEQVDHLDEGQGGIVLLDRTPFYAEGGGQIGDLGELVGGEARFAVEDTTKASGLHLHLGTAASGAIHVGDTVNAHVARGRRDHTRRNHTATHLLHAALKTVLGGHVQQKGSLVGPDRLRFDFSHHKPMTDDEVARIEDLVNDEILRNTAVEASIRHIDEAREAGAVALFGEKYGERVRVISVPGFSVELCGGTHVQRTGDIGLFKILSEAGVAAGVRRIEAQTGHGALRWLREQIGVLSRAADALKTSPDQVPDAIVRLQEERRAVQKQLDELEREAARAAAGDLASSAREIGGVKVLAAEYDGDLREQADRLRDQLGTSLVVLAARRDDKVQLIAAASKDIAGKQVHAGNLIKELAPMVGGRGGGRPDMAQAGGRDAAGISQVLDHVYRYAEASLGA